MTNYDPTQTEVGSEKAPAYIGLRKASSVLVLTVMFVAALFGAGYIKGHADAGGEDLLTSLLTMSAVWILMIAGLTWLALRLWPKGDNEPLSPSTKRSRHLVFIAMGVGGLLGVFMATSAADPASFFSNGPMPIYVAIIAIAVWLVGVPIGTLMWWRSTDEHDRASYADGANVAGHAYLFIAPAWWIATRAGLLPAQDPMIVFLIVASIWSAVWLYRRYF